MASSKAQRVGIWVIAVAMTAGTVVSFIVMILASQSSQHSQQLLSLYQAASTTYSTQTNKQQSDLDARSSKLSEKYSSQFVRQKSRVAGFDAKKVTKLVTTQLAAGSGAAIAGDTTYAAYYIGFTPDGKIFDSSLDGSKLKTPLIVRPDGVIPGWANGMKGQKIGGIYELTIPSDDAYGAAGSGDKIKPNTPLKFIVMPIETMTTYKQPELTKEIIEAYGSTN